jgi:hypothetical protein
VGAGEYLEIRGGLVFHKKDGSCKTIEEACKANPPWAAEQIMKAQAVALELEQKLAGACAYPCIDRAEYLAIIRKLHGRKRGV